MLISPIRTQKYKLFDNTQKLSTDFDHENVIFSRKCTPYAIQCVRGVHAPVKSFFI